MCFHHIIPHALIQSRPASNSMIHDEENAISTQPCRACGKFVQSNFTWCPYCSAALKEHPCVFCGQLLKPGILTCGYCGGPAIKS